MTSPAQLQYLHAMGIPVWVSRELVIEGELHLASSSISSGTDSLNDTSTKTNKTTIDKIANSSGANALDNILQGLEQNIERPVRNQTTVLNQSSTETIKLIVESIDSDSEVSRHTSSDIPHVFAKTTQHTIYTQGSKNAEWMVIGQNPEFVEHQHGEPFIGEEGVLLENMMRAIGISNPRRDAYLVNVLKNSQQQGADISQSKLDLNKVLHDCLNQVKPKIIIIVGQLAAQNILESVEPLARLRGKSYSLPDSDIYAVVTYYPSYLLSKPTNKRKAWDDLKLAMKLVVE